VYRNDGGATWKTALPERDDLRLIVEDVCSVPPYFHHPARSADVQTGKPAQTRLMNSVLQFDLEAYSRSIADLVEHAGRSVVAIKPGAYRVASGIVLRENLIAVNNHQLKREGTVPVHLPDGTETQATVLGRDPTRDVAILQTRDVALQACAPEDESNLNAGALVVVVGRTIDAGLSASVGILGAVGGPRRTWRGGELTRFLRLDVNLYPSQAGALVFSASRRCVGMATGAMLRHSALAIPPETLNQIADELLREGRIRQGYLGVGLQPVTIPDSLRSKSPLAGQAGLMVLSVESGTGADKAGLQLGDILIAAEGVTLSDTEGLLALLRGDAVDKPMNVTLLRAGNLIETAIQVTDKSSKRN
jgi:S1-C subfamily serine protease